MVVFYAPLRALMRRLPPFRFLAMSTYQPLELAANQVATTLDPQQLVDAVVGGIQATFDRPALAFYRRTI